MNNQNEILNALSENKNFIKESVFSDKSFQTKLIKLIIDDSDGIGGTSFSNQIIDILKPQYFDNPYHSMLYTHIVNYITDYNVLPLYDTLKSIIKEKESDNIQREQLIELVDNIQEKNVTDKAYIQDRALDFCRKQALKSGLLQAAEAWEREDYDNISNIINNSLKAGEPNDVGHDYFKDVDSRITKEHRNPVPCLKGLDIMIDGGLSGGELGIVLSPTGGGKSMMLVKFAATALQYGKNVLYYTLELREKVIGNRVDSCLFSVPLKDIANFGPAIKEQMKELKAMGGHMIIKEFPTQGATVNTLRAHLKTVERDNNFKPDVILIDYADIMKSTSQYNEKRFSLTSIYEALRGMSMELKVPIWTASQSNRESIGSERFDLRNISESLGKAQTADLILGLARPDSSKAIKEATLMILKNRNGEDGNSFDLHFDTSKINIYIKPKKGDIIATNKAMNAERMVQNLQQ